MKRGDWMNQLMWIVLIAVTNLAQEQFRVEPAQKAAAQASLTAEQAWEWKERFCPEPAVELSSYDYAGLSCLPPGDFCGWDSECCSGSCQFWRCQ